MIAKRIRYFTLALFTLLGVAALLGIGESKKMDSSFTPAMPKTWEDEAMESLEVPLADPAASPEHVSSDYYYRIPERPMHKSYPVYAPGKEPPGYLEWLKQQEPVQITLDASKLKTEEDWIKAGEMVFDAPIFYNAVVQPSDVSDPAWYEKVKPPVAKDGTLPFLHYVIREKGKIELGNISCAMCHTRVLADGTVVKGAQGNYPFELTAALDAKTRLKPQQARAFERSFFAAPCVKPDWQAGLDQTSIETIFDWHATIPTGVIARHGTSPFSPAQVPDLIGVRDRKYLDHTGLQVQRSVADMMRYSALNQGADFLASYKGFIPGSRGTNTLPDPSTQLRYSETQLYALALYIYSLKPPPNPNKFDALAVRGQKVFQQEGCALCHTPPLYTNNKLTPADGFKVPEDHLSRFDILPVSIGTDPTLALKTRRGTGYYKVPSLKGVWYRGPFEHNGSVATLEDWFDPKRLRDDYVPTGFRGFGVKTRAVKGHEFGLKLSTKDRQALIAFLKTL